MVEYALVEYLRPTIDFLNRDNIGIVCRLSPRGRPDLPNLVVATTHLLFNKKRTDIRLAQIGILLAEVDRLSWVRDGNCPSIITGDMNSSCDSEVYELLTTGNVVYKGRPAGSRVMRSPLFPPDLG